MHGLSHPSISWIPRLLITFEQLSAIIQIWSLIIYMRDFDWLVGANR